MTSSAHRFSWVVPAACFACAVPTARSEPITSIFVDQVSSAPAPLTYTAAGGLTVDVDSFTVLVTRDFSGTDVTEFIENASFELNASGLVDSSTGSLASGLFSTVDFELRSQGGDLLLAGQQLVGANLLYSEALVPDVMFVNSGPIEIVGGSLAGDFLSQALVFGIGLQIDPSTAGFDQLDTDHGGSVKLNLFPVPEPTSLSLWAVSLVACRCFGRSRRRRGSPNGTEF